VDWNRCSQLEALAWLRICLVPGVAPSVLRRLLAWAGTPFGVLEAPPAEVAAFAGEPVARALSRGADPRLVESTMRWLDAPGRHLVPLGDPEYPAPLLEVDEPPPILYAQGRLELLRKPALAIVGSRNATAQGLRDANAFASALSQAGLTIVSGLALGVDAEAHRGGLAARGSSLAILGTGPDIVYPAVNADIARALAANGCLVSEFPLRTPPVARNFPRRNRLISGLAKGVLVIEAGLPSGTLTTARIAAEQGREVFALPGSIHSPVSKGCHWLIREGAMLVEDAQGVLDGLGWSRPAGAAPAKRSPARDRDELLEALGFAPATLEQLASRTGLEVPHLTARMSMLELAGRVIPLPGGAFQRVETG
jgi:DNA processing protein